MNGKSARRSSLFLLELMISILMFSVASAWCVRLFVTARSVVSETEEQNRAQNLAAGYAELFLASEDFDAFLVNEGAGKTESDGKVSYRFCCDEDWNICGAEEGSFVFDITVTEKEDFAECSLLFRKAEEEEEICSLTVEKYTGGEAAL